MIAPFFQQKLFDRLEACDFFVICFDEIRIKVVQMGLFGIDSERLACYVNNIFPYKKFSKGYITIDLLF